MLIEHIIDKAQQPDYYLVQRVCVEHIMDTNNDHTLAHIKEHVQETST